MGIESTHACALYFAVLAGSVQAYGGRSSSRCCSEYGTLESAPDNLENGVVRGGEGPDTAGFAEIPAAPGRRAHNRGIPTAVLLLLLLLLETQFGVRLSKQLLLLIIVEGGFPLAIGRESSADPSFSSSRTIYYVARAIELSRRVQLVVVGSIEIVFVGPDAGVSGARRSWSDVHWFERCCL